MDKNNEKINDNNYLFDNNGFSVVFFLRDDNNNILGQSIYGYYDVSSNNIAIFDQPYFKYCYSYYDKGLLIYFDSKNHVIQIIILLNEVVVSPRNYTTEKNFYHMILYFLII